ncbi:MAG: hypothetical protein CMK32_03480 [Porticoccaceae bacterium]|nr:hypothetical protein [Porticoccaceae bacterium]
MYTLQSYQCPDCNHQFHLDEDLIGVPFDCSTCGTELMIPPTSGLPATAHVMDDDAPAVRRRPATTPVEMRLPGQLGSLKAQVDQPTSNAMATTFLGGLLVALGAFLFAGFMGKGKSS